MPIPSRPLLQRLTAALLSLGLAMTPGTGRANEFADLMNMTAIMLGCSLGTLDCRPARQNSGRATRRVTPGGGDAIALSRAQKRIVQGGLRAEGHYNGPIDGLIGSTTRAAIRDYQSAIGAKRTGYLTDAQIAALMAAAPEYAGLDADDPRLFEIDFHENLDAGSRRDLQYMLNSNGFDAGPVDGAIGRRTRAAIAAYKTEHGLGGPARATQRLFDHMSGGQPVDRTPPMTDPDTDTADPRLALRDAPGADAPPITSSELPAIPGYDIVGLTLGMQADQTARVAGDFLGAKMTALSGTASSFGGNAVFGDGQLVLRNDTADPLADQIALFFDPEDPQGGAIAILRSFLLPDDVTQDDARSALADKYGSDTRIGDSLIWIEDPGMRLTATANPAAVARCGRVAVTFGDQDAWNGIGGPRLDPDLLDGFDVGCGAVLSAQITQGRMTVILWDSDRITARKAAIAAAEAAKPKIKL